MAWALGSYRRFFTFLMRRYKKKEVRIEQNGFSATQLVQPGRATALSSKSFQQKKTAENCKWTCFTEYSKMGHFWALKWGKAGPRWAVLPWLQRNNQRYSNFKQIFFYTRKTNTNPQMDEVLHLAEVQKPSVAIFQTSAGWLVRATMWSVGARGFDVKRHCSTQNTTIWGEKTWIILYRRGKRGDTNNSSGSGNSNYYQQWDNNEHNDRSDAKPPRTVACCGASITLSCTSSNSRPV